MREFRKTLCVKSEVDSDEKVNSNYSAKQKAKGRYEIPHSEQLIMR